MSDILTADKRYIWHPFTQHATEADPIVIKSAKAASLFDDQGNEILDMIASWWTCIHGHAHPEINKVLAAQCETLEHVMFSGFTHEPAVHLAEKLAGILPGDLNRTFFSDNGSTAVEVALKLSYQYWNNKGVADRTRFLAFDGAYHGDTLGAMSVGKGCGFYDIFQGLMCAVDGVPFPATWDGDDDVDQKEARALSALQTRLDDTHEQYAAMIVEPLMQGASGVKLCRPEFLKSVVELVRSYGILIIFDEVAVGFGRVGSMFACNKVGIVPDFICLSKGLVAGYMPLAVTVTSDRIFDAFLDSSFAKAFTHGHTFTGNPLACSIALKSLALFDEENTLARIGEIEALHSAQLPALHAHPLVSMPRVMGSVLAFNLSDDGAAYKSDLSTQLRDFFLARGLNIRPLGNAVYLMPPYCITDEQLKRAYDGIFEGLRHFEAKAAYASRQP